MIHGVQKRIFGDIKAKLPDHVGLVQVPIRLFGDVPEREASQRTRGLVFMLVGAACALLEGQHQLFIYENGVGAINLPFRASEVGLDHARSVHPLSLHAMSNLVSHLIGTTFTFCNPFLFSTKAQMCQTLLDFDKNHLIFDTVTCDHWHREAVGQCGRCSSCLLRRQALAVVGIQDQTPYVVHTRHRSSDGVELRAMLCQVATLQSVLYTADPWRSLSKQYPILFDIVDRTAANEGLDPLLMQHRFVSMYRQYVDEWNKVRHQFEQELLEQDKPQAAQVIA